MRTHNYYFFFPLEHMQEEHGRVEKMNGDLDKVNEIYNCAIYIRVQSNRIEWNHAFRNKRLKDPTSFIATQCVEQLNISSQFNFV